MELNLQDYGHGLDANKLPCIKIISIYDFDACERLKVLFPSGAHSIRMYLGGEDDFKSLFNFFMHVRSLPYADWGQYSTFTFLDKTYSLESVDSNTAKGYIDAYLEAFFEYLFPVSMNAIGLVDARIDFQNYKEGFLHSGAALQEVFFHADDYFCLFSNQSID